jgi:hypothetical protein
MAKDKYDVIVEAVHYKPGGEVEWVRAYERRGATYSDHLLIQRKDLIERLKSGKKILAGKRVLLNASTFEVTYPLRVITKSGVDILISGEKQAEQDYLEGVPLI